MKSDNLHDVIVTILTSQKELTISQIKNEIVLSDLWRRPSDGKFPNYDQISARINNHPELFQREKGVVNLVSDAAETVRLLRLTWNENDWLMPSPHKWKKEYQGNSNYAYENQFGFGGEEWLLNPRYNIDGFQYGYIRGLLDLAQIDSINVAHLFSINQATKDRFLLGTIKNLELLDPTNLPQKVIDIYKKYLPDMLKELKNANADYSQFRLEDILPIVRFKLSDLDKFPQPVLFNELKVNRKYNRFKPYIVETSLEKLIEKKLVAIPFNFKSGKRKNANGSYVKNYTPKESFVEGIHVEIIKNLELFLKPYYSINKQNISIESTVFGGNIADIVTLNRGNSYSIYEVKTSHNTRSNIREAIGQLLDYSFWYDDIDIKEIVIVAPSRLSSGDIALLQRINRSLTLKLRYLQYTKGTSPNFNEINL